MMGGPRAFLRTFELPGLRAWHRAPAVFSAIAFGLLIVSTMPAFARAPIVAPEPPRKIAYESAASADSKEDEKLDLSRQVDSEQARELLMKQLMRAAEAGIVNLQPGPEQGAPESLASEAPAVADLQADVPTSETGSVGESTPSDADEDSETASRGTDAEDPVTDATTTPEVDPQEVAALAKRIRVSGTEPEATAREQASPEPRVDAGPSSEQASVRKAAKCFSRAELRLPDVLPGQHLSLSIGELRKNLVGEFDTANPEPAIELAKTYLAVGMIHEARAVIFEYAPDHALGQFYLDLSNIWNGIDTGDGGSVFKDECIGVQALWRAFAQAREGNIDEALRSEVSSGAALEELPLYLRQVVSSELGLAAAKKGQWDSARRLSAMARRAANGTDEILGKTHLLSFRLAKWRDENDSASEHLALAALSDTDTATEALLIRAEEALRSENVLDPAHSMLREDLGALARREIGSDLAQQAFELEARLFHRQAGADETIDFLSDAVVLGLLEPEQHPEFLSELISKPAFSDVARPLAHLYLENPARFDDAIDQKALRRSLVRSLAQEGIPGIAKNIARGSDIEDPSLVVELAQSFVDAGEFREAIAILSKSTDGVRQRLILSQAFLAMGDFEKSIATLVDLSDKYEVTDTERRDLNKLRLKAEIAGQDYASAYETTVRELNMVNDAELAKQSALISLEAGAGAMDPAVISILDEKNDSELGQLQDIFSLNGADLLEEDGTLESLNETLKSIEASEKAILEVLKDG